jgi:hypothetical protein
MTFALVAGLLALVGLGVAAPVTLAAQPQEGCLTVGAGVVPSSQRCDNRTYAQLSASFWQYALAQPASTSPILGSAGTNCQLGQSGSVFFLAGRFDDASAVRTCTVPSGKALYFPLISIIDVSTPPGFCTRIPDLGAIAVCAPESPAKLLADVKPIEDSAVGLNASLDGQPLSPSGFRVQSGAFSVFLPADNVFGILPKQAYMAVADGYYLLLAPLPAGTHTLVFGGATPANQFAQNISYTLTVGGP